MRRPVWFRALIAIWGFWFTAALSGVPGIRSCMQHDGHAAGAAGHAMHMAHDGQSSAPADDSNHAPAGCSCFGFCCCAAPVATPSSAVSLADAIVVAECAAPDPSVASPRFQRDYSRPFANGPPEL